MDTEKQSGHFDLLDICSEIEHITQPESEHAVERESLFGELLKSSFCINVSMRCIRYENRREQQ